MPPRKMRVEVYDEAGNRYAVVFEGRLTREKALRVIDLVELLGGMASATSEWEQDRGTAKIEKVRLVVEKYFPAVWFNAKDAQAVYEAQAKEPIDLSSISTYLSRLASRGLLTRTRNTNRVQYRVASAGLQRAFDVSPPFKIPNISSLIR